MKREKTSSSPATYAEAGVSIDAGNALVERIKPLAKATARNGLMGGIGGFGALFDIKALGMKDPILVSTTDGVGTKLKLAIAMNKHDTIGIDLVAMCVNDLVVQGAEPLFFLDYFATGKLSVEDGASIIKGIAEGCKQAGCALVGGETAEMPGMYAKGEYDLAGFAVGAAEREELLPSPHIFEGDVLLGIGSSGFHSNGYSLVRHIMDNNKLSFASPAPFDKTQSLGEALLTPTRIYAKSCMRIIRLAGTPVKALAHITGGGLLENIPRILPPKLAASIDASRWELPPIFRWLKELGHIEMHEMYRTFNCGIGMVMVVSPEDESLVKSILINEGETVYTIGKLVPRADKAVDIW